MAIAPDDYVNVLVPKGHLTKVYGFIASLDTVNGAKAAPTEVEAAQEREWKPEPTKEKPEPTKEWTPELIKRQFVESPDSIKAFQRHLAAHPDVWFSTGHMAITLKAVKGSKSIAGALGAYGRRVSNRYAMNSWPFKNRWDYSEGQQYYSMAPEVAEIIDGL
ncbi:MAG: hypothetical protein ABI783_08525 [Actinomycetota bacterium]